MKSKWSLYYFFFFSFSIRSLSLSLSLSWYRSSHLSFSLLWISNGNHRRIWKCFLLKTTRTTLKITLSHTNKFRDDKSRNGIRFFFSFDILFVVHRTNTWSLDSITFPAKKLPTHTQSAFKQKKKKKEKEEDIYLSIIYIYVICIETFH